MKKLLGLALAAAVVISAVPAKAEIFKNLQTKGELEVYGVMTQNVTDAQTSTDDNYRNTMNRLTFGATWDMLDDLHANITAVKNDRYWGQAAQDLNTIQTTVLVQEANIVLDDLFGFKAKIGRSFYGNEGDIIVYYGNEHMVEGLPTSSVDLASFVRQYTVFGMDNWAEVTYAKTNAGTLTQLDDAHNFWAFKNVAKLTSDMDLGIFAYNKRVGNSTYQANGENLWIFDVNTHGKASDLSWAVELAGNVGYADVAAGGQSYKGVAAKADLAYNAKINSIGLTPRLGFAYGSGDTSTGSIDKNFKAINPNYQPGYIYGKSNGNLFSGVAALAPFANTNSVSNRQVWNIGLDIDATEKFSVIADWYNFWANNVAATFNGQRNIGSELDLTANYAYASNVDVGMYAARFDVGGLVKSQVANTNPIFKIGSYVSVRF
ncbi:MAG: alginate export family protein [Elusimicrobiaceae bacterium]|nr:alginate export family protein [Elusimicrobiaceae bacterium]